MALADPPDSGVRASGAGGSWTLDGEVSHVVDGVAAHLVLVPARTAAGTSLFAVEPAHPAVCTTPLPTMDQTRKQAALNSK